MKLPCALCGAELTDASPILAMFIPLMVDDQLMSAIVCSRCADHYGADVDDLLRRLAFSAFEGMLKSAINAVDMGRARQWLEDLPNEPPIRTTVAMHFADHGSETVH